MQRCGWARTLHSNARSYLYQINADGALYLQSTKHKNFVSRYRDTEFLDFFFSRVRKCRPADQAPEGYHWVSPCGIEMNYIAADTSPIVFQELQDDDLHWAGTFRMPFDPTDLRLDETSGYIYHKSPESPLSTAKRKRSPANAYGQYSMLRSDLVQRHFKSMEIDEKDGQAIISWKGKKYKSKPLYLDRPSE